jgi:hypothetical protein
VRNFREGTERLTLRHFGACWTYSRARFRLAPLRLWRFGVLLINSQVDSKGPREEERRLTHELTQS